jgi:DNA-binding transcriptional MerR regulator
MAKTVAQIAEWMGRQHGTSKEAFIQRVRHWTRERLLSPTGKRNPGTGRHRTYADTAYGEALILEAMSTLGLPISMMREVMSVVRSRPSADKRRVEIHWWEEAKLGRNVYLEIVMTPDGIQVNLNHDPKHFTVNEGLAKYSIIFNLTRLFDVALHQRQTGKTNV